MSFFILSLFILIELFLFALYREQKKTQETLALLNSRAHATLAS